MRSADFKRADSKIRVLEEVRPAPKKWNWDRMIYLGILIAAALTSLFFVFKKNFYLHGEGQVLFKKLDIQFTQDIQIIDFAAREGDMVEVGDTMFVYYDENSINHSDRTAEFSRPHVISSDNLDWIIRERLMTEKRIELARIEIEELERLNELESKDRQRIEKEVYLDIYPVSKIEDYDHRIMNYNSRVVAISEEIRFQRIYLNHLVEQEKLEIEKEKLQAEVRYGIPPKILHAYISPVKGTVTQIMKENFEVALESDVIMSIHKPTNLVIKAFYDQEDLHQLKEGDVVDVTFPDGTESMGVLDRFYFATYELPEEFQKKYEPTTRSIVADISPINEIELEKWKAFYKLNVHVSKALF